MYMLCWVYFFIFLAKTQPNDASNTAQLPTRQQPTPFPPPVVVRP